MGVKHFEDQPNHAEQMWVQHRGGVLGQIRDEGNGNGLPLEPSLRSKIHQNAPTTARVNFTAEPSITPQRHHIPTSPKRQSNICPPLLHERPLPPSRGQSSMPKPKDPDRAPADGTNAGHETTKLSRSAILSP